MFANSRSRAASSRAASARVFCVSTGCSMSVALVRAGTLPLISRGCVLRTCLWLPYGRACGAQVVASSRTRLRRSTRREQQEILEEDAAVARFVRMFPARAALVPVFKRLLEMKLHRIDQLAVAALDHHLISAEV